MACKEIDRHCDEAFSCASTARRMRRVAWLVLVLWPRRWRQRARLLELEPHELRDIGIDRKDALREGRKPFWR